MIINGTDVTTIIETILKEDVNIVDEVTIVVGDFVNDYPSYAHPGWIGIYKDTVDYIPNTLGGADSDGNNPQWRFNGAFLVLVQFSSLDSGEHCTLELEALVQTVIQAIFNSVDLRSEIDQITGVKVSYSAVPQFNDEEPADDVHFQQALITFDVEVDRR